MKDPLLCVGHPLQEEAVNWGVQRYEASLCWVLQHPRAMTVTWTAWSGPCKDVNRSVLHIQSHTVQNGHLLQTGWGCSHHKHTNNRLKEQWWRHLHKVQTNVVVHTTPVWNFYLGYVNIFIRALYCPVGVHISTKALESEDQLQAIVLQVVKLLGIW